MKGFDAFAGVIKSGGKTRRAAKMVILNVGHPDIEEFIDCKMKEEKKAWALIDAGYDGNFNGGEAYASVFFQNSNNSRARDRRVHGGGRAGRRLDHHAPSPPVSRWTPVKARYLLNKMAEAAWVCGDPGIQYHDNINRWHTVGQHRADQRQQPVLRVHVPRRLGLQPGEPQPDEVRQGRRRVRRSRRYKHAVRIVLTAQEIIVDNASYPTPLIEREQPRLPAAGPGLRQPGRAAHEPRPGLRLR